MITTEENLILDMLLAKRGHVPAVEITNRKESVKEMQQRLYKNCNKHKALRSIKKNLK